MQLIREPLYTEGANTQGFTLNHRLKEFHDQETFDSGLDWQSQTLWAMLTDDQCFMFCLKYPEYTERFTPWHAPQLK